MDAEALIEKLRHDMDVKDQFITDLMAEAKALRLQLEANTEELRSLRKEMKCKSPVHEKKVRDLADETAFMRKTRKSYILELDKIPNPGNSPEYENRSGYESNIEDPLEKGQEIYDDLESGSAKFSDDERMMEDFQEVRNRKDKRRRKLASSSDDEESKMPKRSNSQQEIVRTGKHKQKFNKQVTRHVSLDEFPPLPNIGSDPITPVKMAVKPKADPRPIKPKAIPPIVISNAGKFVSISNIFRLNNVRYSSAIVIRNGIKVFPCSVDDYKRAIQLLDENKEPFFTFRFPEEKSNHVVLRGVPVHLSTEEILADLQRQGFNPKKVIRWAHANRRPMPLVLVLLPKSEKDIFKVRVICTFEVRAEAQQSKSRSIQCYNCQDHGHAAPSCHIPPKCVKCGKGHRTSQCSKSKEEPPKCANCAGDHPASFSGCPRHPSQVKVQKQSSFRGWGTQDNSRLAPNMADQSQNQAPKPDSSSESFLSQAQLAQIAKMFAEHMKGFMAQTFKNVRT